MLVLQFPRIAETLPQNFWSRRYSIALKCRKSHSQRHSAIRGSVFSEQTVNVARYMSKSSFREVLTKISFLVDFTYTCIRVQNPKFETDQESIHLCDVSFYAGGQNCKITEYEYEIVVYSKLH